MWLKLYVVNQFDFERASWPQQGMEKLIFMECLPQTGVCWLLCIH